MLEYNGLEGLLLRTITATFVDPNWVFDDDEDWIGDLATEAPEHLYVLSKARGTYTPNVNAMALTFVFLDSVGVELAGGTASVQSFTWETASAVGMPEDGRGVVRESDEKLTDGDLSKIVTCKFVNGPPNGLQLSDITPPVGARTLQVFGREHRS